MKLIITKFIHDEQEYHQATSDTNSKPQNIDEGKHFLFPEILKGQ
jgi:hypothetical protein